MYVRAKEGTRMVTKKKPNLHFQAIHDELHPVAQQLESCLVLSRLCRCLVLSCLVFSCLSLEEGQMVVHLL
jgi:hypothetical protein